MKIIDKENVIKALECCSTTNCTDCPYTKNGKVDIFDITCSINMAKDTLALIKELTQEIKELEVDYDRVYKQAEADIHGNMTDGGTSCHWCMDKTRDDTVRKMQEKIRAKSEYGTINISPWQLDQIAKEMLEENNGIH